MPKLETWVSSRVFRPSRRGVCLGPHAASLLRLDLSRNDSLASLPRNLIFAPLSLLCLPRGLVPETAGVKPWNSYDDVTDFSAFHAFLSLHGTLPRLSRDTFHVLPSELQDTILAFLMVNGRRRGDGRRRLIPRGVDVMVVEALVELEKEEREARWRERPWEER